MTTEPLCNKTKCAVVTILCCHKNSKNNVQCYKRFNAEICQHIRVQVFQIKTLQMILSEMEPQYIWCEFVLWNGMRWMQAIMWKTFLLKTLNWKSKNYLLLFWAFFVSAWIIYSLYQKSASTDGDETVNIIKTSMSLKNL